MVKMTKLEATQNVGGLSHPSKMPGPAFGLAATKCKTGSKLAKVEGSVCHDCYALKGRYVMPNVAAAHARRLEILVAALSSPAAMEIWIQSMSRLMEGVPLYRWHDSGDIQSADHLSLIVAVCIATPATRHWLPTKELKLLKQWRAAGGIVPSNLTIRVSGHMVDQTPGTTASPQGSMVYTDVAALPPEAHVCPIYSKPELAAKTCTDAGCNACWQNDVALVAYPKH